MFLDGDGSGYAFLVLSLVDGELARESNGHIGKCFHQITDTVTDLPLIECLSQSQVLRYIIQVVGTHLHQLENSGYILLASAPTTPDNLPF